MPASPGPVAARSVYGTRSPGCRVHPPMLSSSDPSVVRAPTRAFEVQPLSWAALGASNFTRALMAEDEAALSFYRRDPFSASARTEAAREAAATPRDRETLVEVLREQNAAWNADDASMGALERLLDPESVTVVTGQQLGLFAGPLYTSFKALTAVRMARRLEEEAGRPVVPMFWLADEDHDFAEIRRTVVTNGPSVQHITYNDGRPPEADRGPVGRLELEEAPLAEALHQLEEKLPVSPFRGEALEMVRDAYRPGRRMRDAFARLLHQLTAGTGLVLVSADEPRLKVLVRDLFAEEASDWTATHDALKGRSEALQEAGFHAQVEPSPGTLFLMDDAGRRLLVPEQGGFRARGGAHVMLPEALRERIEAYPECISPNVVLRPVMQDRLLPTAAYVGGPGEVAYFAQLAPVYDRFGVPMPVIAPRLSLTLVAPAVRRILTTYDLTVPDLREGIDRLHRALAVKAGDHDLDAAFEEAQRAVGAALRALETPVIDVDSSLDQALGAAEAAVRQAVARLETKTVRVEKRQHAVIGERLERAHAALWPAGTLQERVLSPLQVVAEHGPDALVRIVEAPPLDPRSHWLIG